MVPQPRKRLSSSNQLITTIVLIEIINYVKITRHILAHLESSSGDTQLKL
jgi:hypothetical protein